MSCIFLLFDDIVQLDDMFVDILDIFLIVCNNDIVELYVGIFDVEVVVGDIFKY